MLAASRRNSIRAARPPIGVSPSYTTAANGPDHPGSRSQPRHEVVIRRLFALPRELVPGGPEPLELLGRPRDLDPELRGHLAGLNTKPTCAPRCRGSPPADGGIAFGIATSTRTGRVLDRDRDHARGAVLHEMVDVGVDVLEPRRVVLVDADRAHGDRRLPGGVAAVVALAADRDQERSVLVRLEVGVGAPAGAPAVRVELLDGVEQMPGLAAGVVERHRSLSLSRRGRRGRRPCRRGRRGSRVVRQEPVGVDEIRRRRRSRPGRGPVEARRRA